MRNIFAPRLFRDLTLLERLVHGLVVFGLPLSLLNYLFIDRAEVGWLLGIPLAFLGGMIAAIFFAFLEHAFFRTTKRPDNKSVKGSTTTPK
jgi:predicted outer membrane lipoprotein